MILALAILNISSIGLNHGVAWGSVKAMKPQFLQNSFTIEEVWVVALSNTRQSLDRYSSYLLLPSSSLAFILTTNYGFSIFWTILNSWFLIPIWIGYPYFAEHLFRFKAGNFNKYEITLFYLFLNAKINGEVPS